jgi:hypothetical protein
MLEMEMRKMLEMEMREMPRLLERSAGRCGI